MAARPAAFLKTALVARVQASSELRCEVVSFACSQALANGHRHEHCHVRRRAGRCVAATATDPCPPARGASTGHCRTLAALSGVSAGFVAHRGSAWTAPRAAARRSRERRGRGAAVAAELSSPKRTRRRKQWQGAPLRALRHRAAHAGAQLCAQRSQPRATSRQDPRGWHALVAATACAAGRARGFCAGPSHRPDARLARQLRGARGAGSRAAAPGAGRASRCAAALPPRAEPTSLSLSPLPRRCSRCRPRCSRCRPRPRPRRHRKRARCR